MSRAHRQGTMSDDSDMDDSEDEYDNFPAQPQQVSSKFGAAPETDSEEDSEMDGDEEEAAGGSYSSKFGAQQQGSDSEGEDLPADFKPGDWLCADSRCKAHNYASKTACFQCGKAWGEQGSAGSDSDSDSEEEEEAAALKMEDIPMGEILAMKRNGFANFGKKHAASATGYDRQGEPVDKRSLAKAHRENKHRPLEVTSKRAVGRHREVVKPTRRKARDPRFDPMSGSYDPMKFQTVRPPPPPRRSLRTAPRAVRGTAARLPPVLCPAAPACHLTRARPPALPPPLLSRARQAYGFLNDYRKDEIAELRKQAKKIKNDPDGRKAKKLQIERSRLESTGDVLKQKAQKALRKAELKKVERDLVAQVTHNACTSLGGGTCLPSPFPAVLACCACLLCLLRLLRLRVRRQ